MAPPSPKGEHLTPVEIKKSEPCLERKGSWVVGMGGVRGGQSGYAWFDLVPRGAAGATSSTTRERVEDELRAITVLFSENLAELSSQSAFLRVEIGASRTDAGTCSSTGDRVEFDRSNLEIGCPCCGEMYHYSGSESEQGEEVGLNESWSSTSESSLRVFFPRHTVRV